MPDTVTAQLAAAAQQGVGDTLRIVLLVSLVGAALLAWFLLRGYRADDTDDTAGTTEAARPGDEGGTGRDANA
ncbi:hypothetical protein ACIQ62_02335 [Streptomyces sp. NPDC096319]|uniref:hypothetical protein n=1 Tax=Streptomyces sp. NPDC096319 TaxID=3366084 RepID=UPI00382618F2